MYADKLRLKKFAKVFDQKVNYTRGDGQIDL
jgi:hypothetical protein